MDDNQNTGGIKTDLINEWEYDAAIAAYRECNHGIRVCRVSDILKWIDSVPLEERVQTAEAEFLKGQQRGESIMLEKIKKALAGGNYMNKAQELGDRIATKAMMKKIGISELEKYIEHESPYVRSSVAIGICHLGGEKAYELWLKLMDDPEELIVGDAILHAGMLNDPRCLGVIIEAYAKYGYHLRSRVINSLPYFNDPKAEEFFKKLKKEEKDPALRKIIESVEREQNK